MSRPHQLQRPPGRRNLGPDDGLTGSHNAGATILRQSAGGSQGSKNTSPGRDRGSIPLQEFGARRPRAFERRSSERNVRDQQYGSHEVEETVGRLSIGSAEHSEDDAPLLARNPHDDTSSNHAKPGIKESSTLKETHRFAWSSASNRAANEPREIHVGRPVRTKFPPNTVSNAKYSAWSFLPLTLYNEFSFFFNMYFLLVALSQIVPALRIGYLSTYVAPLIFVLAITLGKEALDDIARRKRDSDANKEAYTVLRFDEGNRRRQNATADSRLGLPLKTQNNEQLNSRPGTEAMQRRSDNAYDSDDVERGSKISTSETREVMLRSRDLKVGDIVKLGKDQRVPADLVILRCLSADVSIMPVASFLKQESSAIPTMDPITPATTNAAESILMSRDHSPARDAPQEEETGGEAFIRTDQLDGETDWKLRLAPPLTQSLPTEQYGRVRILAGPPDRSVNDFVGSIQLRPLNDQNLTEAAKASEQQLSYPLNIDNTAWANTVIASNVSILAVVAYTGVQTRQALSTSPSRSKAGLLEYEINNLTKILCALTLTLSVLLVAIRGIEGRPGQEWYVAVTRFLILFSTIVPISLRVNLDMGKTIYARFIERDEGIPGTVVRTSTIPEDLGRIEYLLSDKTGTLTQNEMDLKKIHIGTVSYANEAMDEVNAYVRQVFSIEKSADMSQTSDLITPASTHHVSSAGSVTRSRREIGARVRDLVMALALCHNVTPSTENIDGQSVTSYQASSPDEIAIVKWAENVGLRLFHRDRHTIKLQSVTTSRVVVNATIMDVFPFTSTGKRMGIILRFAGTNQPGVSMEKEDSEEFWFFQKGADTVMAPIVAVNDWLDEETGNMAREGLRTLVIGRKRLSKRQYDEFAASYRNASLSLTERDKLMAQAIATHLEHNLELLGVTGVEDKLQRDVKPSLELLRNAGIKIWMLTGDKVETARCVAVSAKLVSRTQYIHTIVQLSRDLNPSAAVDALSILRSKAETTALLIDGDSLGYLLNYHRHDFISLAVQLPAVIACRCSPTQKADVALLIRQFTKKRVACIGDGGNDVSMIQAADVGVGIVGKEGRQASLAADFSITSFHHLTKLLVWHGRNSYKRSAKLAQFVIHRGLIISVCQTFYSIATELQPHALYRDWLLVGYATIYTMAPVFSLVLDKDVDENLANLYPELYKELTEGRSLSYRTFFVWVAVSIYQGAIIQGCSQLLVNLDSARMVSVSFTVLIINELVMVAFEIVTWHWIMFASILGTAVIYVGTIPFLGGYFDLAYLVTLKFAWTVAAISALSLIPPYAIKILRRTLRPPSYRKVQGI